MSTFWYLPRRLVLRIKTEVASIVENINENEVHLVIHVFREPDAIERLVVEAILQMGQNLFMIFGLYHFKDKIPPFADYWVARHCDHVYFLVDEKQK